MKNIGTDKKFLFSTSYADVYSTVYKNNEALLFEFHPYLIGNAYFQKSLHDSKNTYERVQHTNALEIFVWNSAYIITERVELWNISSTVHYERLCHRKELFSLFFYLNSKSIHHGSLHPEFVFVRPNKSIAVMGWRFSQRALPMIQLYRPPQKYNHRGDMDSDLYAIALLSYELISRKKPWEPKCTRYEIQKRKEISLLRPLTAFGFSRQKSAIFHKALSHEPSVRFSSIQELKHAWTQLLPEAQKEEKAPTIGHFHTHRSRLKLNRNQQSTSLFIFGIMLILFIGQYESSARAGNTSWKRGYSTQDGTEQVEGEMLQLTMIPIPKGIYTPQNTNEESQNINGFLISQTEITQKQWSLVMNSIETSSKRPVTNITWLDAIKFCNALSVMNNKEPVYTHTEDTIQYDPTKNGYRLPTEQEWVYAAQGSEQHMYSGTNEIDTVAWTSANTKGLVQTVQTKAANAYGLHDMTGNAAEWVYTKKSCVQNNCSVNGIGRIKGGSVRSSQREHLIHIQTPLHTQSKRTDVGFRIVIDSAKP